MKWRAACVVCAAVWCTSSLRAHAQPASEPEPTFGATGRTSRPERAGETRVQATEAREVPGAFGDPLRVIDALPGFVPAISGLPYGYVRGAPPATVGYSYDDIPLPTLYHFALGPSVVHPRVLGTLHYDPGVPPARYGRRLGGQLAVDAPPMPPEFGGEVELRLLDANGFLRVPVAGGTLAVAARYGYPGPLLSVVSPDATLAYWDYQARLDVPMAGGVRAQVIALGSFDELINPASSRTQNRFGSVKLEFHRVELRMLKQFDHVQVGAALRAGIDRSAIDQDLSVHAFDIGPRLWVDVRASERAHMRFGADFQGSTGSIESAEISSPLQIAGQRQLRLDVPLIADAAARSAGGVYGELELTPASWTTLELGARGDLWIVDGNSTSAFDPRMRWTVFIGDSVTLHIAAGMAHQPAAFLFPLPGLTDVALDRGVQESLQSEAGVALQLPWDLRLQAQFFAHHYARLLLPELYAPDERMLSPRADALSYGGEFMLRREGRSALTGWISYTLGFADARVEPDGARFSPEFDIRHVLNVVVQEQLGAGFSLGGRLLLRSGKPFTQFDANAQPIYELRLPAFVRIDARFGYSWRTSWGAMQAYLEWLNVTIAQEALGAECFYGTCRLQHAPAIFFPNAGVRAQF